ncbi:MAG: phosphatase PAP2 family protein [Cyclobacteriaceae bacterium]|nr:phosphatase PAP2 family protein [Cyclobacteriaceae bacterium]
MEVLYSLITVLIFTGYLRAQPADSLSSNPLSWKSMIAPASLITGGLLVIDEDEFISRTHILEERKENAAFFNRHIDDYLQYTPAAAVFGLNALGIKGKNSMVEETILLVKSELLMTAIIYTLKQTTNIQRPDSSTYNSFPSGHTAQAFVAATFLHKEYGHKSIWYSIGAYSVASTVACMRVLGNRHWLSDVFVGAGIGILSTELVYATHKHTWSKRKVKLTGLPTYNQGAYGIYLSLAL